MILKVLGPFSLMILLNMYRNSRSSLVHRPDRFSLRSENLLNSISDDLNGMSMSNKPSLFPGMNVSAGFKRRSSAPAIDATEMESVNCISQRLAKKMSSPLFPKRVRSVYYSADNEHTTRGVSTETDQRISEPQQLPSQSSVVSLPMLCNRAPGGSLCGRWNNSATFNNLQVAGLLYLQIL